MAPGEMKRMEMASSRVLGCQGGGVVDNVLSQQLTRNMVEYRLQFRCDCCRA